MTWFNLLKLKWEKCEECGHEYTGTGCPICESDTLAGG